MPMFQPVPLGYCIEIQLLPGLAFGHRCSQPLFRRQAVRGESEAPRVEQWRRGHVERPSGLFPVVFRDAEQVLEHRTGRELLAPVAAAELGTLVVAGEGGVHGRQYGVYGGRDRVDAPCGAVEVDGHRVGSALGIARERMVPRAPAAAEKGRKCKNVKYFFAAHPFGKVFVQS